MDVPAFLDVRKFSIRSGTIQTSQEKHHLNALCGILLITFFYWLLQCGGDVGDGLFGK